MTLYCVVNTKVESKTFEKKIINKQVFFVHNEECIEYHSVGKENGVYFRDKISAIINKISQLAESLTDENETEIKEKIKLLQNELFFRI